MPIIRALELVPSLDAHPCYPHSSRRFGSLRVCRREGYALAKVLAGPSPPVAEFWVPMSIRMETSSWVGFGRCCFDLGLKLEMQPSGTHQSALNLSIPIPCITTRGDTFSNTVIPKKNPTGEVSLFTAGIYVGVLNRQARTGNSPLCCFSILFLCIYINITLFSTWSST